MIKTRMNLNKQLVRATIDIYAPSTSTQKSVRSRLSSQKHEHTSSKKQIPLKHKYRNILVRLWPVLREMALTL